MAELFPPSTVVLFDLDGTLIETHIDFPAMTTAMLVLARENSVPAEVTQGKDILGLVEAAASAGMAIRASYQRRVRRRTHPGLRAQNYRAALDCIDHCQWWRGDRCAGERKVPTPVTRQYA